MENGETAENVDVAEGEKKSKPKGKSKKKAGEKSGEEGESTTEGEEGGSRRGRKRKSGEMEEEKNDGEGDSGQEEDKKKKRKKGKGKSRRGAHDFRGEAAKHGDPSRIEDIFPMALTYMSDPKEAPARKIISYINKYYPEVDTSDRLKTALDKGESQDMWQHIGGQGYRLLLEEFNPGYSSDRQDMISQAIIATHEPKTASAAMIKKYILQYHENFKIDERPFLFKKALERACSKNIIRQVSGLGSGGSFQLVKPFVPSPAILAGEIDDKAEFLDFNDVPDDKDEIYIVRRTKSGRGAGIKREAGVKERKPPAVRK